jgi:soluble epoxide hydrolase / lipid-phosphate phosphatase
MFNIVYTSQPELWIQHLGPTGALKAYIENDTMLSRSSYLTEHDEQIMKKAQLEGGFAAKLNWYKAAAFGVVSSEYADKGNIFAAFVLALWTPDKIIHPDLHVIITAPVFFGAALRDAVCLAQIGKQTTFEHCKNATVKEFDTGHFVQFEAKDEVNKELKAWIEGMY